MTANLQNDQTAPLQPDQIEQDIKGKRVIIIGSGSDNDGRRMQKKIDGNFYDYVIRVNKHYGKVEDTGNRTDIIFTRWLQWISKGQPFFSDDDLQQAKKVIIINQQVGISQAEIEQGQIEIGHSKASAGLYAALWCLNRGVRQIDLIGYGHHQDGFTGGKKYCQNSYNYPDRMRDNNALYEWSKEQQWLTAQPQINLL